MAPAFLVLKKNCVQIEQASSCEEVIRIFDNGFNLWSAPNIFIDEVEAIIKALFIEERSFVN
jgi:hypothetical protein